MDERSLTKSKVRLLYQKFPYPAYPLWARLRWQDAFHLSSDFTRTVCSLPSDIDIHNSSHPKKYPSVLIAGCGDTLPYIIRNWEPSDRSVTGLDFSRVSLNRAKLRMMTCRKPIQFVHNDIESEVFVSSAKWSHIDCYGVLHHLDSPKKGISAVAQLLRRDGTTRLMLYNSKARSWIFHIARAFQLLKLDPNHKLDYKLALKILKELGSLSETMNLRLVKSGILHNPPMARIVDTFFHPREARLSISDYFSALSESNLKVCGLWDRYGELDDLLNPLLSPPSVDQLEERSIDRRYENNLELYCVKWKEGETRREDNSFQRPAAARGDTQARVKYLKRLEPPRIWFGFDETRHIPLNIRRKIWMAHIEHVYLGESVVIDETIKLLSANSIKRLSRLGAFFPKQIASKELIDVIYQPIHDAMEAPIIDKVSDVSSNARIQKIVLKIMSMKGLNHIRCEKKRYDLIMARLMAAQR